MLTEMFLQVALELTRQNRRRSLALRLSSLAAPGLARGHAALDSLGSPISGMPLCCPERSDAGPRLLRPGPRSLRKIRFRPEIALTRLELAELLLEHYPDEHDAAIEHLDFAIAELRDMKMQPALERALHLLQA